ncbi:MAG: acyl dehydratase [Kangiellaceae bacterium]|jgi:acyl dehydratase
MDITQLTVGSTHASASFHSVTQAQIQQFADATGDHQWIHLDTEKCKKFSPYKKTIAHGFLTLSLMPQMFTQSIQVDPNTTTMINYGMDSLRFIEAVRVDDKIKYLFTLVNIEKKAIGDLYRFEGKVVIDKREKPALIGSFLTLVMKAKG